MTFSDPTYYLPCSKIPVVMQIEQEALDVEQCMCILNPLVIGQIVND